MVYCGRLSLVADLLQGLFKDAYSLQKGLLELLEKIPLNSSASEEEISDIVTGARLFACISIFSSFACGSFYCLASFLFLTHLVIHTLLDICFLISNLDMALHANTWKFLIRYAQSKFSIMITFFYLFFSYTLIVYIYNCQTKPEVPVTS